MLAPLWNTKVGAGVVKLRRLLIGWDQGVVNISGRLIQLYCSLVTRTFEPHFKMAILRAAWLCGLLRRRVSMEQECLQGSCYCSPGSIGMRMLRWRACASQSNCSSRVIARLPEADAADGGEPSAREACEHS
jgi:hypothetical protein